MNKVISMVLSGLFIFFMSNISKLAYGDDSVIIRKSHLFSYSNSVANTKFSQDGMSFGFIQDDHILNIIDLKNSNMVKISHPVILHDYFFIEKSNCILVAANDGIYDFRPGKKELLPILKFSSLLGRKYTKFYNMEFSGGGHYVALECLNKIIVLDILKKKFHDIIYDDRYSAHPFQFSPDERYIVVPKNLLTSSLVELVSGKERFISHTFGSPQMVQFTSDGKELIKKRINALFSSTDDGVDIQCVENGKEASIGAPQSMLLKLAYSDDASKILISYSDGKNILMNRKTGSKEEICFNTIGSLTDQFLSSDGKFAAFVFSNEKYLILYQTELKFFKKIFINELIGFSRYCKTISFSKDSKWMCIVEKNKIRLEPLCQIELLSKISAFLVKDVNITSEKFTSQNIKNELVRLSSIENSLISDQDIMLLLCILNATSSDEYVILKNKALQRLLCLSFDLYEAILDRSPVPKKDLISNGNDYMQSAADQAIILSTVQNYVKHLISSFSKKSTFLEIERRLTPLLFFLSSFPTDKKYSCMKEILEPFSQMVVDTPEFYDLSVVKVIRVLAEMIKPFFGITGVAISEIMLIRTPAQIEPVILSSLPINNNAKSSIFGFYIERMAGIQFPSVLSSNQHLGDKIITWKMADKYYEVQLAFNTRDGLLDIVPQANGPNYRELWKDRQLTGMVISGANMQFDLANSTFHQYRKYFQSQGFVFDEGIEISDVKSFLRTKVISGELDYFMKEAHADGEKQHLFLMNKEGTLFTGTFVLPDGKKEKIYLVFPKKDVFETYFWSNEECALWMKERVEQGGVEFVYFNASCKSDNKALHEIRTIRSKFFVDIPTRSIVYTFLFQPDHSECILISSFRRGLSYSEMRDALKQDERYRTQQFNLFIFPDENEYKRRIIDALQFPIEAQYQIFENKSLIQSVRELL